MSFQRTRMSAERTLMSVIRTSLSLVGFGFTIFQFFQELSEAKLVRTGAARHFGTSLLVLGTLMLVWGISFHLAYMSDLRQMRTKMKEEGLIRAESSFPVSLTLITAVLLLVLSLLAFMGVVFR